MVSRFAVRSDFDGPGHASAVLAAAAPAASFPPSGTAASPQLAVDGTHDVQATTHWSRALYVDWLGTVADAERADGRRRRPT